MFKKNLFMVFFSILFIACSSFPGDAVETSKNDEDDDGIGTKKDPYIITENIFYSTNDSKTYYEFNIDKSSQNCQLIVYVRDLLEGDFSMSSDVSFNEVTHKYFNSYKNMTKGKYTLSSQTLNNANKKIAIYSPCLKYKATLANFVVGKEQSFNEYNKLYAFDLTKEEIIKILNINNINEITLMNEDFEEITYFLGNKITLKKGKYYILARGTTDSSFSKFQFETY